MAYDYRDIDAAPLPWEEVTGNGRGLKVLRAQDIEARYRRAVQAFSEKALPVGGAV